MDALELTIVQMADVISARRQAREYAAALGFDESASEEILLVVSELGNNLVSHAGGGILTLSPREADAFGENAGITIVSADSGSGLDDVPLAFRDGYSTGGSLGYGMGTVNRLMDTVTVNSNSDTGTYIVCARYFRKPRTQSIPIRHCAHLDIGAATRALPGCDVNGDAFVSIAWDDGILVGVIDGVGHGREAHRAACAARQYVEKHFDRPLAEIFSGTARVCHGTRGVVMALARFDCIPDTQREECLQQRIDRITFASIGNIEARAYGGSGRMNLQVRRGILGLMGFMHQPVVSTSNWCADHMLVIHSDGVRSHWSFDSFPEFITLPADQVAAKLLHNMGRAEDDATVLVVKNKPL